ncbi:dipeptide/oligopeptide/nickel ABC transporter permease/ATP-binding protein [Nocardioides sp. CPCC 205120]|uniref:dipeptide/oligopeptide/nickel ABC transporter permease/ATP-binding protein n=1 Tax=Nocardioides sp. CPCC 205120 TaxID=3406462 RepID=UPI003B5126D1
MTEQLVTLPAAAPAAAPRRRRLWARVLRRPAGVLSLVWIALMVGGAVLADVVAPYGPLEQDLSSSFAGPGGDHLLGADQLGRDVLSRILHGGQVSLLAVAQAVVVFVVVGTLTGLVAGYRGGRTDRFLMWVCDVMLAIPLVVTLLVVLAVFSRNETAAMLTFGFLASAGLGRVVRAAAMTVRTDDYVLAAEVAGLRAHQVVVRHVLPRVLPPVLVQASLLACSALLVESGINYLGLGVQPPTPSWGGLVTDASAAITSHPWLLVPSGGVIVLTALAFGVLGDVVRDVSADRSATAPSSWRQLRTRVRRTTPAGAAATPAGPATPASPDAPASPEAPGDAVLELRGLRVLHQGTALVDDVDLRVLPGEVVGLVGESGCGKTLTLSALLRLLPPGLVLEAERLEVDGADALDLPERRMAALRGTAVAFVPQEPVAGLDPSFTVRAQLREVVRLRDGGGRAATDARVRELLEQVQLPDADRVLAAYPHELSGGMAQRVAIARALAGRPRVLLADEPTTALDVTVQAEILALLRDLRERTGLAIVIVTHDWGVVAELCDRAVVMYAGRVVEEGTVLDLFDHPAHPYTGALMAANPTGARFRERLRSIPGQVPSPQERSSACAFADRCERRQDDCTATPVPLVLLGAPRGGPARSVRCLHPVGRPDPGATSPDQKGAYADAAR